MFSVQQKRQIADAVQRILRGTGHPELPAGEISFCLKVQGAEDWSWADIRNNGAVTNPSVNPWNEAQAQVSAAAPAVGQGPTLEEVEHLCEKHCFDVEGPESMECLQGLINDALARWGNRPGILDSSITPPPELVQQWWATETYDPHGVALLKLATKAARWGAAHALPLPSGEGQP